MPELPDLTVYAENLGKIVTGKKIIAVQYHRGKRLNVSPEELSSALVSHRVTAVGRVGKEICFSISNGAFMYVHLMLSGGFVLTTQKEAGGLDYPVISVAFEDGSALAVTDPKGWASVTLSAKPRAEIPDALGVTADYLKQKSGKKPKTLIKALLTDQQVIGGIGNAYVDEILWRARISPKSEAGKLPPEAIDALVESIPAVLNEAIHHLRKNHPAMISGEFREFLKVHGPSIKVSPTGAPVIKEQILSKVTYYTDEQVHYK